MAKLYFRYGAMGSAKTANLLMTSFNFEEKGFKVLLIKPSIDDRFSVGYIESRIGIKRKCFLLEKNQSILPLGSRHRRRVRCRQSGANVLR